MILHETWLYILIVDITNSVLSVTGNYKDTFTQASPRDLGLWFNSGSSTYLISMFSIIYLNDEK
jgi:hypothetical protein